MDWAGFALAVLLIELTPGPNMAWLAGLALVDGRRAALAAVAGVAVGLMINGMLAAAGLALLVSTRPEIFAVLRWGGAVMMLWLAYQAWRDGNATQAAAARDTSDARHFWSGLAVNLLNPKALLFYIAIAPQFLGSERFTMVQALTLTAISASIATVVHLLLVWQALRAHGWVSDPRRTRLVRRALAIGLLGVALWFVAQTA